MQNPPVFPGCQRLFADLLRSPEAEGAGGDGPSDRALVQAAQAGDRHAFSTLVERYRPRVHGMIFNMVRHDADAWDLTQDCFIKAWKALPKFERRANFFTWIYRIAHNVTYDFLRRKRPETAGGFEEDWQGSHLAPEAELLTPSSEAPDAGLARGDLREALEKALGELSPAHRQAILLKEVQGLKYHEIAEVMECSTGTVMSRLFYARKRLQELLREARADFHGLDE